MGRLPHRDSMNAGLVPAKALLAGEGFVTSIARDSQRRRRQMNSLDVRRESPATIERREANVATEPLEVNDPAVLPQ